MQNRKSDFIPERDLRIEIINKKESERKAVREMANVHSFHAHKGKRDILEKICCVNLTTRSGQKCCGGRSAEEVATRIIALIASQC